jgi:RHS repeat-associated protein
VTRKTLKSYQGVATTNFFLWDGMELCEQRSGSNGGTVDKRFFGMGVQRVTGSDTGKFFYTFDHLGSIRELIDSSQVVRGRWDYGPWGDPSANLITSSAVDSDFKYTGHYHHATSGLILAPMRPYDPVLERWLTDDFLEWADPFQPQRYVHNDPIGLFDPLGLAWEATLTQGVHYNDRASKFAFGLGVDPSTGRLTPVALSGHTFDQARADKLLNEARNDKKLWKDLRKKQAELYDLSGGEGGKAKCQVVGRAMRLYGVLGAAGLMLNGDGGRLSELARRYVFTEDDMARMGVASLIAEEVSRLVGDLPATVIYGQLK